MGRGEGASCDETAVRDKMFVCHLPYSLTLYMKKKMHAVRLHKMFYLKRKLKMMTLFTYHDKELIAYRNNLFSFHDKELIAHRNNIPIFGGIIRYPCAYLCTCYIIFSVLAS